MARSAASFKVASSAHVGQSSFEKLPTEILLMIGSHLTDPDPPPPFARSVPAAIWTRSLLMLACANRRFREIFLPQFWQLAEWKGRVFPATPKFGETYFRSLNHPAPINRSIRCSGFRRPLSTSLYANISNLRIKAQDLGLVDIVKKSASGTPLIFESLRELTISCAGYTSIGFSPAVNFAINEIADDPWELQLASKDCCERQWLTRVDVMLPALKKMHVERVERNPEDILGWMRLYDGNVTITDIEDEDIRVYVGVVDLNNIEAYFDRTIKYRDVFQTLRECDFELGSAVMNMVKLKRSDPEAWEVIMTEIQELE